ncbi:MAG TPA: hypothetical protein VLG37_04975 [Candidatus Saccharimonadales bacterium]|nr:hypothetical protein [Candidatus Saccharimonadales bacterium]
MIRKLIYLGIFAIIVSGATIGVIKLTQSRSIIPKDIKKQLNIVTLLPKSDQIIVDHHSFKYDSNAKVLTFVVSGFGIKNTISEQATPDPINDIPQYLDKLTESLHEYTSFDTAAGKVYLTRPEELKGDQSAVMNSKGVLMFAHPEKDLTDDQWRQFFNSLDVIR